VDAARETVLPGLLFGGPMLADFGVLPEPPRVELREHRGEWLLLHWYAHHDGEAVRAITRVELDGDRIALLRNYFYSPEFIADVCAELDVPHRSNGHHWWVFGCVRE
jgi:RNA polymerase sigma-70 factor (ECF subfamily)